MIRYLAGAFLMTRLACQRLEVSWDLCLQIWLTRPAIEIVLEDPSARRRELVRHINEVYPF